MLHFAERNYSEYEPKITRDGSGKSLQLKCYTNGILDMVAFINNKDEKFKKIGVYKTPEIQYGDVLSANGKFASAICRLANIRDEMNQTHEEYERQNGLDIYR